MKIIKKENVFNGYYRLNKVEVKSEKTGKTSVREQFVIPNSVAILIYNPLKNKIVLLRQFRVGAESELIEIVAGKMEDDEKDPVETAKREVLEESGYRVDRIKLIHEFYTTPGPVTEKMKLFYAEASHQTTKGGGLESENEEIEVFHCTPQDFVSRQFTDAKTIIAQQYWQLLNAKNS